MILVDDAGGFIPAINHSPWNGVNLADFIMPFFLFIVGVALALAYKVLLSCYMSISCSLFLSLQNNSTECTEHIFVKTKNHLQIVFREYQISLMQVKRLYSGH
jgi:hypothetical protein